MAVAGRRQTLGPLGANALNQRQAGRQSLAPPTKTRQSLGGPAVRPPRPSSIGGRGPKASLGGRPSIGVSLAVKTDPRDVRDAAFKTQAMVNVVDFLVSHNYDRPVGKKVMSGPSNTEFLNIFMFLFHCYDPHYKFTAKPETDVLPLLKRIGYPFSLTKSVLASVGAAHSWPTVLAALDWMVNLLKYEESASQKTELDVVDPEKLFSDYLAHAYQDFMAGVDAPEEVVAREIANLLADKNGDVVDAIKKAKLEEATLRAQIDRLKVEEPELAERQTAKNNLLAEVTKFIKAIDAFKVHNERNLQKHNEALRELDEREKEYKSVQTDKAQIKQVLDAQVLRPEDAQRMVNERSRLETEIRSLGERKDIAAKSVYDLEIGVANGIDKLEKNVQAYNMTVVRLVEGITMQGQAVNASPYTITLNLHESDASRMTSVSITDRTAVNLASLKQAATQQARTAQSELVTTQEALDKAEEALAEKEELVRDMEGKLKKLENQYKMDKEALQGRVDVITKQMDAAEEAVMRLRNATTQNVQESNEQVAAVAREFAALRESVKQEKEACSEAVLRALDMLAAHKDAIQERLAEVHQRWVIVQQEVKRLDEEVK